MKNTYIGEKAQIIEMWEYNFVDRWCMLCVSDFQSWFKKDREKIFRIYVPFASKPIFPIPYKLVHIPIRKS